ncbi:MAG: MBL fold metallo-hydrolase [Elusimicrobia bacterium]|nr:MBL fold metallo-hydrolase [Elusimicrobiota bacterium]
MNIKFWGTRGSISAPGPETTKYGGNTACVEISNSDTLAIFDAGTGIRLLGEDLLRRSSGRVEGHLFISHFHFDHIVGFPFFRPLYGKNNKFTVYGCEGTGRKLENIFVGQMSPEYFPVTMSEMPAELQFVQVTTRPLNLNGWTITPAYINHPGLALAYKIENGKSKVVYMTDNEPFRYLLRQQARKAEIFDDLKTGKVELEREDLLLVDFFEGADVLIHDGQYTQAEYPSRLGWGHSFFEFAVEMAVQGHVKKLMLFHHDPDRTDAALDKEVEKAQSLVRSRGLFLEVDAAREGLEIALP